MSAKLVSNNWTPYCILKSKIKRIHVLRNKKFLIKNLYLHRPVSTYNNLAPCTNWPWASFDKFHSFPHQTQIYNPIFHHISKFDYFQFDGTIRRRHLSLYHSSGDCPRCTYFRRFWEFFWEFSIFFIFFETFFEFFFESFFL